MLLADVLLHELGTDADVIQWSIVVGDIGRSSFTLLYEIMNATTGQKLADAKTVLVAYDYAEGKSTPLSPETRALLERARVQ